MCHTGLAVLRSTFSASFLCIWSCKYAKWPGGALFPTVQIDACVSQSQSLSQSTLQKTSLQSANFSICLRAQRTHCNTIKKNTRNKKNKKNTVNVQPSFLSCIKGMKEEKTAGYLLHSTECWFSKWYLGGSLRALVTKTIFVRFYQCDHCAVRNWTDCHFFVIRLLSVCVYGYFRDTDSCSHSNAPGHVLCSHFSTTDSSFSWSSK